MGVGNRQPLQNIIITILYHEHFLHGTSTFNGNSVPCTMKPTFIFTPKQSQNEEEKKNF